MGNLIFGTIRIDGRKFDDIKIQTSKAGVPRPIVFGTVRPITGNIIATTAPEIRKRTERIDNGWLAPDTKITHEEVFRTYAIRICEGPVTGITRVWRNNELVYERDSENATQVENNEAFLEKAEFFLGSFSQMPSSVMQAAFGINKVHAYRGTCYMVVDDENLTATGGAIPQYAFEVQRCEGFVLTSRPYTVENGEIVHIRARAELVDLRNILHIYENEESLDLLPKADEITLKSVNINYEVDPEPIDLRPFAEFIQLQIPLIEYAVPEEPIELIAAAESIELEVVVIVHQAEEESLDLAPSAESIILEIF